MKDIGAEAFKECSYLKSAQLNEGLKELGGSAFTSSAIESIALPSTLKKIEAETFSFCENLKSV